MVKIINDGGCGAYGHPYNLQAQGIDGDNRQFTIGVQDFSYEFTKEQIQEEIDKITKEKVELDSQIKYWVDAQNYLEETGVDNFDEMEFKSYQVLQTINENTSDIEKAKIIAKIIQG